MSAGENGKGKVLMLSSVASMIDQFNMPNIRLLQEMGYEVHVACNFKEGSTCSDGRIEDLQERLRSMHVVWRQWNCPRTICPVVKCIRALRQLWKLTGKQRYAWIHCHSPVGGAIARIVAHGRNIRVIYTAHGFHFYKGAPVKNWLLYYPAEKLLSYWTEVLLTVNREDYRFAKRNFHAKKVYCVPGTGVRTGRALHSNRSRRELCSLFHIPESAWVLLSVGELTPRKNHRLVLEAMALMKRTDVYYVVCGQGELCRQLRTEAGRYGLADRLRLVGFREHLDAFYCNCDIFVFPSVQEGLPVALMEAMAAGMPCVVSDIRGNRELLGDAGGCDDDMCGAVDVRFAHDDAASLCGILLRMMEDADLRRRCAAYNRNASARYDIHVVRREMRRIYGLSIEREFQDEDVKRAYQKSENHRVFDGR